MIKAIKLGLAMVLLATPAMAVEYQGKNIDGRKLAAKAYYSATGGVYEVQVRFKGKQATIYFSDGSQTTIKLRQQAITDVSNIQGFGRVGQVFIGRTFSVGLNYNSDNFGNRQPNVSPLEGFWRISLESTDLK